MSEHNTQIGRREFIKTGALATATVAGLSSPAVIYQVGATDSGEVEIESDITLPSGTAVDLTTYEYLDGADSVSNEQTISLDDGVNTYALNQLEATAEWDEDRNESVVSVDFQWELNLESNSDQTATPEFNPFVVTIPRAWDRETFSEPLQAQPENVEIYYDQEELREYQPLLVLSKDARESIKGMYAYAASSPDWDYDVYCYWVQYTHQGGLPFISSDSHLGDHEPIYVFAEKDSGEVHTVVYSGYHWFASELNFPDAPGQFVQERHSEYATHATLKVVSPWHNYTTNTQSRGVFVPLNSWIKVQDAWAANGFYAPAGREAIDNPITMLNRDTWWNKNTRDYRFANLWRQLGMRGGASADELRAGGDGGDGGFWPF